MCVCVCVCVCDAQSFQQTPSRSLVCALYYQLGLKAFTVLAALATGGLGVSGLEPACGPPYATPGPPVCRGAA